MYDDGMATWYGNDNGEEIILENVRLLRASREPCIVCGHPTGDCGDGVAPKRILGQDAFPSLADQTMVYVEEDLFEERQVSKYTTAKFLVARKGSQISLTKAKELGLL